MVTTLHSDDPEMTTPQPPFLSKIDVCFFLTQTKELFYEHVKLFSIFFHQSRLSKRCLFGTPILRAFLSHLGLI